MKKKIISITIALIILAFGSYAIIKLTKKSTTEGSKEIQIKIENRISEEQEILYEGTIKTDAEYLGEILDELIFNGEFTMETSDSGYGRYIVSFNQIEGESVGAYWMFDSENNAICVESGYCSLGIDSLPIDDQDNFIFYLSNEY